MGRWLNYLISHMFHSMVVYKELSFKPVVSLCISTFTLYLNSPDVN